MANYATASRTKDYHQKKLLDQFPEIISIGPRQKPDAQGHATDTGIIVIGVRKETPRLAGSESDAADRVSAISKPLQAIDDSGNLIDDFVEVVVEYVSPVRIEQCPNGTRPCPGGYGVGHPLVAGGGTLGGVVFIDSVAHILSNNHVLANSNEASVGHATWQPAGKEGGKAGCEIAFLADWVHIDFKGGENEVDCAVSKIEDPWQQYVSQYVYGIGTPTGIGKAYKGQHVRKSGKKTGVTCGRILSDNETVKVDFGDGKVARYVKQLVYSRMTAGGDSGSLIFDAATLTVVGLHFAGSDDERYSYGNKIDRVLTLLGEKRTEYDANGKPTECPAVSCTFTKPA